MLSIDPNSLSEREKYKFLIGSIIPRPIAFVTTEAGDGTLNAAPFSYFNVVSSDPPRISISVGRKAGERKDTAEHILMKKQFVVHIVDSDNVEKVNLTAEGLPRNQSEVKKFGLTPIKSDKISVPGIAEAKVRFECELETYLPLNKSNGEPGVDFFIGKIVQFHIDENIYEKGRVSQELLKAVGRLAGNDYMEVDNSFTLKRPN
ncbi:flavin reductase family protein [Alkalihalobacillus sp. 1P02AB]|uniref:flavin reductase family protein n=1 Tax=Alkalihalobacillus sp. 1P02AB TaxID=3132260 RepID=UPI0039A77DC5